MSRGCECFPGGLQESLSQTGGVAHPICSQDVLCSRCRQLKQMRGENYAEAKLQEEAPMSGTEQLSCVGGSEQEGPSASRRSQSTSACLLCPLRRMVPEPAYSHSRDIRKKDKRQNRVPKPPNDQHTEGDS